MAATTNHFRRALPPPLVFLGYLLGALILNWALPLRLPWLPVRILGGLLVIGGLLLAASAIREMRKLHATPDARRPAAALVTGGPFRFTRNPIYLGFLLIYLGFTLLAGTLWGILLSPFLIATVTRWVIQREEAYLSQRFGGEYTTYRSRIRRWL